MVRSADELIRDTAPFPDSVIEQLPKTDKRPALDYVAWYQYAQRLLLQHGGYSWVVGDLMYADNVWAVSGVLTIGDERYGAVGEDTTPTAAESNAYKRACAHAGIGLHLYDDGYWLHGKLEREAST